MHNVNTHFNVQDPIVFFVYAQKTLLQKQLNIKFYSNESFKTITEPIGFVEQNNKWNIISTQARKQSLPNHSLIILPLPGSLTRRRISFIFVWWSGCFAIWWIVSFYWLLLGTELLWISFTVECLPISQFPETEAPGRQHGTWNMFIIYREAARCKESLWLNSK